MTVCFPIDYVGGVPTFFLRIEKGMQGMALHPFFFIFEGRKGVGNGGDACLCGGKMGLWYGEVVSPRKKLKKEFDVWF